MNKWLGLGALTVSALAATGCASSEEARAARDRNPAPCPNAVVLKDAARLVEFEGDPALRNIAWSAEITDVRLSCRYYSDKPIDADVEIDFAFGRGPAADPDVDKRSFSYFVAVTRTDIEVIEKKTFSREISLKQKDPIGEAQEKIDRIVIPRANKDIAGGNFEIVVGLVLTREQAIYNRSGRSLKFPEL